MFGIAQYSIGGARKDELAATRLLANGTGDAAFGNGGNARFVMSGDQTRILTDGAATIANDERMLMAAATNGKLSVRRIMASGVEDTSFGNGGLVTGTLNSFAAARMILLDEENRFILQYEDGPDFRVVLHGADGAQDLSFGSSGSLVIRQPGSDPMGNAMYGALLPHRVVTLAAFVPTGSGGSAGGTSVVRFWR